MKKLIALVISCVLALSAFLLPAAAAGDLEIDFSTLDTSKKGSQTTIHVFSPAGYTDTVIQFGGPESYVSLGEIDLSQYGSVTIEYGADMNAVFESSDGTRSYVALTSYEGPIAELKAGDEVYTLVDGVDIIGQGELEEVTGNWAGGSNTLTFEFNTNYNGEVFLSQLPARDLGIDEPYGRGDGIAITSITFHEKEGGTTEPSDPSEPSTPSDPSDPSDETPPETGDAHIIFAVAAAGIALTVLIRKKVTV